MKNLMTHLQRCKKVANNRAIPAFDGTVMLTTQSGTTTIVATNLEVWYRGECLTGWQNCSFVANISDLLQGISLLGEAKLQINQDGSSYSLLSSAGVCTYPSFLPEEFPALPELYEDEPVQFPVDLPAIHKKFASSDELRLHFTALHSSGSHIECTDTHTLFRYKFEGPRFLARYVFPGKVSANDTHVFFVNDDHTYICRQLDAKFPNVSAVIPKADENKPDPTHTINKSGLLAALGCMPMRCLTFSETGEISGIDVDYNKEIKIQTQNKFAFAFGADPSVLTRMLSETPGDTVTLEQRSPRHVIVYRNELITLLAMPLQIKEQQ